jgi:insulysin
MSELIKIPKADNDIKDYYYMILPNELKVVIIVDKLSTSCGALINVGVGSTSDPQPYEGMAHFLEHMVFLGSEKYQDVKFMESINKNGGMTNASTGDTDTTYYFSINCDKFIENLNIMADFFISPLLKKENVDKERNAVNSESVKNLLDDNWIFNEIIKKTMQTDFAYNHYTCGNLDTLNGPNLDEIVRKFFNDHYSANIMHLVVHVNSKIDLNVLKNNIIETFSKIINKNLNKTYKYGNLLIPNQTVKYIPNTDIDSLTICLQIEKQFTNLIDSPFQILDWIITSKTDNTIFRILENKGYITDIDIGQVFTFDDNILYIVKFILTKKGLKKTDYIYKLFFDYINAIITYEKLDKIYDNISKAKNRDFNLAISENVIDTLQHVNFLLINDIELQNINTYLIMSPEYNLIKNKIFDFFKQINVHNSSLIISSTDFKKQNYKYIIDKIYNVKYVVDTNIISYENEKNQLGQLLEPNRFITDKIDIIPGEDFYPHKKPELISQENYNFVYNFNSSFRNPEVHYYLSLIMPDILKNPEIYIKTQLYLNSVYSDHSGVIDELDKAGYNFGMTLNQDNLIIYLKTDNNNCDLIINNIIKPIFSLDYIAKGFDSVKEKIYKQYKSFYKEQPIKKIGVRINKLLLDKFYTPYDMKKYIKNAKYYDCQKLFFDIIKNSNTNIVVSGNIKQNDAQTYSSLIYNYLHIQNNVVINMDDTKLKNIKYPFYPKCKNFNKDEKNTMFTLSYILFSLKKSDPTFYDEVAFLNLINSVFDIRYFTKLRTEEQFGYIVHTKISYIGSDYIKTGALQFRVQSPVKNSDYLLKRTLEFILYDGFNYIKSLNEQQFNEYKDGIISGLSNKFNNLLELDIYLCSQIFDFSYEYDYKQKLINAITLMSLDNFIKIFIHKFLIYKNNTYTNNTNFISISIDACN